MDASGSNPGNKIEHAHKRTTIRRVPLHRLSPWPVWCDTDGRPIQAHGGGVMYHRGGYYWYGET